MRPSAIKSTITLAGDRNSGTNWQDRQLLLAIGIIVVHPNLKMPAVTKFIDGTGPVWSGSLFPFLFITIACGAPVNLCDVAASHALL
jgi:Carbon starvation protein CstA